MVSRFICPSNIRMSSFIVKTTLSKLFFRNRAHVPENKYLGNQKTLNPADTYPGKLVLANDVQLCPNLVSQLAAWLGKYSLARSLWKVTIASSEEVVSHLVSWRIPALRIVSCCSWLTFVVFLFELIFVPVSFHILKNNISSWTPEISCNF